ncbi:NAD(P)/FAD-dependent oxidoreductase [Dyella sp. GSA-30]|uniref:FAD-dependent oxidoreductase n=1 Tax=Dyella sp. GSA-30 TaxID=2994496 RepID=UPI0024917379|nr:NAD(P)/FAD-dependent oxidoreductase [Dyella sp. GSA-30]BDU21675.1 oxidoreductase [Dyella sp. GSA-30]
MRVIIIGAGIGGLCLAQGLRRSGVEAVVFERAASAQAQVRGYGIHLDHHGMTALKACLPKAIFSELDRAASYAGTVARFFDRRLRFLASTSERAPDGMGGHTLSQRRGIGRALLNRLLLSDLPDVQWNKTFQRYAVGADGRVTAYFSDGSSETGDLLVGADGSNSRVRQQYLPHIERMSVGVTAIAGRYVLSPERNDTLPATLVDGAPNMLVPSSPDWLFFSAWLTPKDASSDEPPSNARDYVVWAYVANARALPAHLDAMNDAALQEMVLKRTVGWSDQVRTLIRDAEPGSLSVIPLKSMPHLEPWPASSVTLLGDAIHNMTPMAGIGANTALRDAANLVQCLSAVIRGEASLKDEVARYEERMRSYANPAVLKSLGNAQRAGSGHRLGRMIFRTLLRLSGRLPWVEHRLFHGEDH